MGEIGLVLGAGGIVGGAYHAGALAALAETTGWDPRSARVIVGTSAGAVHGAILRAGLSAADQYARISGEPLSPDGEQLVGAIAPVTELPRRPPLPRNPLPASPRMVATALLPPWPVRPSAILAGLLPAGSVPTAPIGDRIRLLYGTEWPDASLWVCALRLRDGQRVVFGRDDVKTPDVGTAVEASAAIPGYLSPVTIDGDAYVDGGSHSATNADVVAGLELDAVIVISPLSADWSALRPAPNVGSRAIAGWALDREVRQVRATGTPVLVLQPTTDDVRVMGTNSMDPDKRLDVARQARCSTVQRLEHPAAAAVVNRLN